MQVAVCEAAVLTGRGNAWLAPDGHHTVPGSGGLLPGAEGMSSC